MTQTYIGICLQIEGFHYFPEAHTHFGPEVVFLEVMHRHIFHIEAKKKVRHDERDEEFILLKRRVERYYEQKHGRPANFGSRSCETIARELMEEFQFDYVKVSEDGENYAEIVQL